ncbi:hypothetical protein KM043_013197 [Ampulex compressa]|nr:hypothetical protein KM043_013197 [Ampulex compressa]
MRHITRETFLRYKELLTLLIQIEVIFNSRPLRSLSSNPNELLALTAGHFLTVSAITSYSEPSLENVNANALSRWQPVDQLGQQFWKKWNGECLHICQQSSKWNTMHRPAATSQLVIVREKK